MFARVASASAASRAAESLTVPSEWFRHQVLMRHTVISTDLGREQRDERVVVARGARRADELGEARRRAAATDGDDLQSS